MDKFIIDDQLRNNLLKTLLHGDVKGLPTGVTGEVLFSMIQQLGNAPKFEPETEE